ncbi:MAG: electron transport complex subunit E [Clostridia bacterium]|nr:electron transport complex subunit E [Clostridia bacterium]MBR4467685.1 electron transport complex subunit E [Clostridia bacterium]
MKKLLERLYNGVFKENPTFVLMLGMCPTLAVTTSALNGLGMGLSTAAVLMMSNLIISLLRKLIPDRVRMPAYIVVVASFVTIVDLLMQAYVRSLYASLGLYIPLIVVNCIILGRAEAYASKNPPLLSLFDGIGMGLGFTVALTLIGAFREILGSGSIFGFTILSDWYEPVALMVMAPGAFFVLAMLTALQNKLKAPSRTNDPDKFCTGNCRHCMDATCSIGNREKPVVPDEPEAVPDSPAAPAAEASGRKEGEQ